MSKSLPLNCGAGLATFSFGYAISDLLHCAMSLLLNAGFIKCIGGEKTKTDQIEYYEMD